MPPNDISAINKRPVLSRPASESRAQYI